MRTTTITAVLSGMTTITIVRCAEIIIKSPPPPPVSEEAVGLPPSDRHVWLPGYYQGVSGRYVWVTGKWTIPPRTGEVHVSPRWVPHPKGYAFIPGHWR